MGTWGKVKVEDLIPHQVMRWPGGAPLEVDDVLADWVAVHLHAHGSDGKPVTVDLPAGSWVEVRVAPPLPVLPPAGEFLSCNQG